MHALVTCVYNRPVEVLERTLGGLLVNDMTGVKVLVVDDGSTVDYMRLKGELAKQKLDLEWLNVSTKMDCPDAYQVNGWNCSAYANNQGIRRAEELGAEYLYLLGSDVVLPPGAIEHAAKYVKETDGVFVGSVKDEKTGWYCGGGVQWPMHWFTCCRMQHVLAIGGFDITFMKGCAFADNDYAARIFRQARRLLISSEVVCLHQSHRTIYAEDNHKGWSINRKYVLDKWGKVPWEAGSYPRNVCTTERTPRGTEYTLTEA
jgi:glycosyltransferase involved in cell wall biosynthesis